MSNISVAAHQPGPSEGGYQGGGYQGGGQGGTRNRQDGGRPQQPDNRDDMGPAFPSEASGMDDVPF